MAKNLLSVANKLGPYWTPNSMADIRWVIIRNTVRAILGMSWPRDDLGDKLHEHKTQILFFDREKIIAKLEERRNPSDNVLEVIKILKEE